MSFGGGNILFQGSTPGSGGGGVTGANSGLSLAGSTVQLGTAGPAPYGANIAEERGIFFGAPAGNAWLELYSNAGSLKFGVDATNSTIFSALVSKSGGALMEYNWKDDAVYITGTSGYFEYGTALNSLPGDPPNYIEHLESGKGWIFNLKDPTAENFIINFDSPKPAFKIMTNNETDIVAWLWNDNFAGARFDLAVLSGETGTFNFVSPYLEEYYSFQVTGTGRNFFFWDRQNAIDIFNYIPGTGLDFGTPVSLGFTANRIPFTNASGFLAQASQLTFNSASNILSVAGGLIVTNHGSFQTSVSTGGYVRSGNIVYTKAFLIAAAATSTKASLHIAATGDGPDFPDDGNIWFDGTNLYMQIGGVTKTFTLT